MYRRFPRCQSILTASAIAFVLPALAQTTAPAPPPAPTTPAVVATPSQRVRATIETIEAGSLTVKDRNGDVLKLALTAGTVVTEVTPIAIDAIQSGSFIGTAALPGPDGRLVALEVLVFPEAARGSSEGHFPWDLQPQSTMTNATVTTLAKTAQGRELVLQYKGGEKTVLVPESVPIVTFKPADRSLLAVGSKVIVTAALKDGTLTALRVLAGRNGFAPPM